MENDNKLACQPVHVTSKHNRWKEVYMHRYANIIKLYTMYILTLHT